MENDQKSLALFLAYFAQWNSLDSGFDHCFDVFPLGTSAETGVDSSLLPLIQERHIEGC